MPTQLLKLRNVPEDEREELYALLEEHEIEYYETSAGNWGASMPALWLKNDSQLVEANALLNIYADKRSARARAEYQDLKKNGSARGILDIARENPGQFLLYVVIVIFLFGISVIPYVSLMKD